MQDKTVGIPNTDFERILAESNERSQSARAEIEAFEKAFEERDRRLAIATPLLAALVNKYGAVYENHGAQAVDLADKLVAAEEAKWGAERAKNRSPNQVANDANNFMVKALREARRIAAEDGRDETPSVEVLDLSEPNKS